MKKEDNVRNGKRKMKNRTLDMFSMHELLKKKIKVEKNLEANFSNLFDFVEEAEGDFFTSNNYEAYGRLEGNYNKSLNQADLLNIYLSNENKIGVSEYNDSHKILIEKIEEKNKDYIKKECEKIMSEKTPEELKERAGVSKEPYVVPKLIYHRGSAPRRFGYKSEG